MGLPTQPVTLSVEKIEELSKKLSTLRHNINNYLALIVASTELIKFKPDPDTAQRMAGTLMAQPPKITDEIAKFSGDLEKALGIDRS